jgi:hypothetical protein
MHLVTAALRGMRFRVTIFASMEAVQWVASAGASGWVSVPMICWSGG